MKIIKTNIKNNNFVQINNDTGFEVKLCDFGAGIVYLKLNGDLLTLSPVEEEFPNCKGYFGKTLGRVGGRLEFAQYKVNDKVYRVDVNEAKTNCLHGGKKSISYKKFNSKIVEDKDGVSVYYSYFAKDGESKFNGNTMYLITYFIPKNKNYIDIDFKATCDQDSIINMSNHAYFNLGNEETNAKQRMLIRTNKVSNFNDKLIVKGWKDVTPVLDFTKGKEIGKDIDAPELKAPMLKSFDHIYRFEEVSDKSLVTVKSSKYQMDCYSDFDAAIFYACGFAPKKTIHLLNGGELKARMGYTMEFMWHEPEVIGPDKPYHHKTRYSFKALSKA